MRILSKSTSFISVKEDIVDVERGSNKRLIVGNGSRNRTAWSVLGVGSNRASSGRVTRECGDSPKALINRTNIKVNLYFVILYITILPHLSVYFMLQGSRLYLKPS